MRPHPESQVDVLAVEHAAHQMRADAIAAGARALKNWVMAHITRGAARAA